jgi:DNA polymerase V
MKRIALIDVNSFYVSCELLFRPDIKGCAAVVLSNNDSCVIARNAKAKQLGIKMGEPYFQRREFLEINRVHVFSSNYALYADMSARVMQVIHGEVCDTEVYSIDESWADLDGITGSLDVFGRHLKQKIYREVGLPVGIGISSTKTLAKLAQWASKTWVATGGVVDLTEPKRQEKLMRIAPVGEIWGIGRKLGGHLSAMNILNAWSLAHYDHKSLRKMFSVNVERTARELAGESCFKLHQSPPPRQEIMKSCMFGQRIQTLDQLRQAAASYATGAAEKLRAQKSLCQRVGVSLQTGQYEQPPRRYYNAVEVGLCTPSDDTRLLIRSAVAGIERIFRPGFNYSKCSVRLSDLHQRGEFTLDLFADSQSEACDKLGAVMDKINLKYGQQAIHSARVKRDPHWSMRREMLSPAYTTNWKDLPSCE